jgi:hypothetical protein
MDKTEASDHTLRQCFLPHQQKFYICQGVGKYCARTLSKTCPLERQIDFLDLFDLFDLLDLFDFLDLFDLLDFLDLHDLHDLLDLIDIV